MVSLSTARASNASLTPAYRPTAIVVGGTSGIGAGTTKAFAKATLGNAQIIIVGRNRQSAESIISSLPRTPQSDYSFIECDATLMKNVVATCNDIKSKVDVVNFLVVSQGMMTMDPYTPTEEGIDRKLALQFYSRWKFCDELIPCLEKAKAAGQEARFMTIGGAGRGSAIDIDDLGLKKTFSVRKAGVQSPSYNEAMVEEYSRRYPNLAFIHNYPGFVDTPLFKNLNWAIRALLYGVASIVATSPDDCGEWMCYSLLSPKYATGGWHLDNKGELLPASSIHVTQEAGTKVAEHFAKETAV